MLKKFIATALTTAILVCSGLALGWNALVLLTEPEPGPIPSEGQSVLIDHIGGSAGAIRGEAAYDGSGVRLRCEGYHTEDLDPTEYTIRVTLSDGAGPVLATTMEDRVLFGSEEAGIPAEFAFDERIDIELEPGDYRAEIEVIPIRLGDVRASARHLGAVPASNSIRRNFSVE